MFSSSPLKKALFLLFARRFMAGERIEDAVKKAKELKEKGTYSLVNVLGEHARDPDKIVFYYSEYQRLMRLISQEGLEDWIGISLKLSQFGLGGLPRGESTAYYFLPHLLIEAKQRRISVEIDREEPETLDTSERIVFILAKNGFSNFRLCVQANQERSVEEIKRLNLMGIPVRLCVGMRVGHYQGDLPEEELENRYLKLAVVLRNKGIKPAYAGHNLARIASLLNFYRHHWDELEFQFLLGIENGYAQSLVGKVGRVTIYISCGKEWWHYGKRRLKSIFRIWWRNSWQRVDFFWEQYNLDETIHIG